MHTNKNHEEKLFDFLFLCCHLLEFQNGALSNLDQLNGECVVSPTFPLVPLAFAYLALMDVYTFFWWRLYLRISIAVFYWVTLILELLFQVNKEKNGKPVMPQLSDDSMFSSEITPLILAAQRNRYEVVTFLVQQGNSSLFFSHQPQRLIFNLTQAFNKNGTIPIHV